MVLYPPRRGGRSPFGNIVILFFITCATLLGHSRDCAAGGTIVASHAFLPPHVRTSFNSAPPVLLFYLVRNGKIQQSAYSLADLSETSAVVVDGYVAGILVFCEYEMNILVDGVRLRQLAEDADGTVAFDYFGRLNPREFWPANVSNAGILYDRQRSGAKRSPFKSYALLPKTILDTVSKQNQFNILLLQADSCFTLSVHHNGYLDVPFPTGKAPGPGSKNAVFRYLGNRLAMIENSSDFVARIAAITEGVALVEETFGLQLVHAVNLIDCEGIENAITRIGHNDIWFFIDTFLNESVAELKSIATHETLHLLVDRYRLTQSQPIRKLFADLKGYGELSPERFFLLTRGAVKQDRTSRAKAHFLFYFINENNFLGLKGGHSQDNLDEFCVSFIHSLLFISRIDTNLMRPLKSSPDARLYRLTACERPEVLDYYRGSIRVFLEIVSGRNAGRPTIGFFEGKRAYIDRLISAGDFSMSSHRSIDQSFRRHR
jgi:hypothetical protein